MGSTTAQANGSQLGDLRHRLLAGEVIDLKAYSQQTGASTSGLRSAIARIRRSDGVDIQHTNGHYQIVRPVEEPPRRPRRSPATAYGIFRRAIMSGETVNTEAFMRTHRVTRNSVHGYVNKLRRSGLPIALGEAGYHLEQLDPDTAEAEIAQRAKQATHPALGTVTLVRLELVGKRTIGTIEDGRGGSWRVTF